MMDAQRRRALLLIDAAYAAGAAVARRIAEEEAARPPAPPAPRTVCQDCGCEELCVDYLRGAAGDDTGADRSAA